MTVSPDHVQVEYVRTYREVDLQVNGNGIFDGTEVNGEVAFLYKPTHPTRRQPCPGRAIHVHGR